MEDRPESFFTTRWTCVARSKGDSEEARAALAELCDSYYAPVHAFIRASVQDADAAQELTQAFFARVLERSAFEGADPEKGRFRSYLLGAVKHFLLETRRNRRARKRGGDREHVAIRGATDTSPGVDPIDPKSLPADEEFDRRWALTLLTRALKRLEEELVDQEKADHFQILKPWLTGDHEGLRQATAAEALGISENAAKVAIHRLRRRFRNAVKEEVAHTLTESSQLPEELQHLESVLRR